MPPSGAEMVTSTVVADLNTVSIDAISSVWMGVAPAKIPAINNAKKFQEKFYMGEADVQNISQVYNTDQIPRYQFEAPKGWTDLVEGAHL